MAVPLPPPMHCQVEFLRDQVEKAKQTNIHGEAKVKHYINPQCIIQQRDVLTYHKTPCIVCHIPRT